MLEGRKLSFQAQLRSRLVVVGGNLVATVPATTVGGHLVGMSRAGMAVCNVNALFMH